VRLDNALDEAQAEAGPLNLRRDDFRRAIERFENPGLIGRRNSDPAIGDRHEHFAPRLTGANAYPAPCPSVFYGVGHQVLEHPAQGRLVAEHGRQPLGDVVFNLDLRSVDERLGGIDDLVKHRGDGNRPERKAALSRVDAGKLQDLFHHLGQPPSLIAHKVAVLANLLLVADDPVGEVFAGRSNHCKRRA